MNFLEDAGFEFFFIKQPNGWSAKKILMAGLCQNHSQSREQWEGGEGGGGGGESGVWSRAFFFTHIWCHFKIKKPMGKSAAP